MGNSISSLFHSNLSLRNAIVTAAALYYLSKLVRYAANDRYVFVFWLMGKSNKRTNAVKFEYGGQLVADALVSHGVDNLFTLTGGHIAPILVAAKAKGINVVDVRHEVNTVFAADASARLTGKAGAAIVTAGPGLTNTITAVKNAQMAQSPVVLMGGCAPTLLKGRGALQDIDQISLFAPIVKYTATVSTIRDIVPTLEQAFYMAQEGTPGPVFVEFPLDVLYEEKQVRSELLSMLGKGKSLTSRVIATYADYHMDNQFATVPDMVRVPRPLPVDPMQPPRSSVQRAAAMLARASKPMLIVSSQALLVPSNIDRLVAAIDALGIPVWLSSMARGLLGENHPCQFRLNRSKALKESDLVILAGVPLDFRMKYGYSIPSKTAVISANRSSHDLSNNRAPTLGVLCDPGQFIVDVQASLAKGSKKPNRKSWEQWVDTCHTRETDKYKANLEAFATQPTEEYMNPVNVCLALDQALDDNSIMIGDGGDFVATAAYFTRPRAPLSWLDPGTFGTLGVGAGFAMATKLIKPDSEVWIVYGDGSCGYTIAEFDTYVRHKLPIIALVGNDGCWQQMYRDQIRIFEDDVATQLGFVPYHEVVKGFGAEGILVTSEDELPDALARAKECARNGVPVLVNCLIGKNDFRQGSISL